MEERRMETGHADLMDRIYSWQTSIYDLTRRYFLFGRDALLGRLHVTAEDQILEMGCGTGRNLRKLAKGNPGLKFFGLDCSQVMLDYAEERLTDAGLAGQVHLAKAYGEAFDYRKDFDLEKPFTKIFCSYSISMIPTWQETLQNCRENLVPGGTISIVDFYDQAKLPWFFRSVLVWWLSLFHVAYNPELPPFLEQMAREHGDTVELEGALGNYYYIAVYRRRSDG